MQPSNLPTTNIAPRWLYRSRQFFAALLGRVSEDDRAEAISVLGPRLYEVFAAMPGQYRHHMVTVYRRVREAGCEDVNVWQAALLHDAGKYDPASRKSVSLPYRVAIVLLKAAGPGSSVLERLAGGRGSVIWGRGSGWRHPFYLSRHHAALGAELAARHGAESEVVRLIAHHHKHPAPDPALAALQAADEKS